MSFTKNYTPWNKGKKTGQKPWNKGLKINLEKYPNYGMSNKKQSEKSIKILNSFSFKKGEHPKTEWKSGNKPSIKTIDAVILAHKGKKLSKETRIKIGLKSIGRNVGNKNYNWKGGISIQKYPFIWTNTLKKAIRERDKYSCQLCLKYGYCIHHIDYDKKNCNTNNLITLCESCHPKTNKNREMWKLLFENKLYRLFY